MVRPLPQAESVNVPTGYGRFMIVATEVQLLLADWTSGTPAGSTDVTGNGGHRGCSDRLWREL